MRPPGLARFGGVRKSSFHRRRGLSFQGHLLQPQPAKISQETLAEMVGTTRSRVSFFMNRFRKLGFIDYHAGDALQVHSSLLNIVLHD